MRGVWTISHDFAFDYGGAERVTETIAQRVLPGARVRVLGADDSVLWRMGIADRTTRVLPPQVVTSRTYRALSPLYAPLLPHTGAVEGNLLASSYAFAQHLRCTGRKVVYCHSPLRQAWIPGQSPGNRLARAMQRTAAAWLRHHDRRAAREADQFIATSSVVAARIRRFYGVAEPLVLPPPIDLATFNPGAEARGEDFLWVGRIVEPYKRVSMLIEAFRSSPHRLTVVGDGRDAARLRRSAPSNVTFAGHATSAEMASWYRRARALIFPSEDDFGMALVEAMACGTPIIAFRGGGALDTMVEGRTGVFFDDATTASLREAIAEFERQNWSSSLIAAHAEPYGSDGFAQRLREILA